jgi:hypothetical protein
LKTEFAVSGKAGGGSLVAPRTTDRQRTWRSCGASWTFSVLALSACLAITAWRDARAQTISSFSDTGSAAQMTFDGLTFSVSNCTVSLCSDVELKAVSSSGGATVEVLGNGRGSNGSNVLTNTNGRGLDLLGFTLTVSGTGTTKISSVSAAVAGTYSGRGSDISSYLAISGTGACTTNSGDGHRDGCATLALGGDPSWANFGPVSSLSVRYDLGAYSAAGQTLALSNATQKFSPAAEPATIGLMATGVMGLVVARLSRKRRVRLAAAQA